ncbi:PAS domain-containing protein [Bacillus sp. FJAT-42315]|uniref:PAS domain-containing protein n=1 Tax=Bacillus sp. FJAT-42315 TaxID=2014077 RepID=UPI000C248936
MGEGSTALESNLAMIEFNLDRKVIWANENFAKTLGYTVNELKNMRHEQFCTMEFRNSKKYTELRSDLIKGHKFQQEIQVIGKLQETIIDTQHQFNKNIEKFEHATNVLK